MSGILQTENTQVNKKNVKLTLNSSFKSLPVREKLDIAKTLLKKYTKSKRFGTVATYAFDRILDHLNWETLICNPSIDSLSHRHGLREYCDDHVSRGIILVEKLGIIKVLRRGRNISNIYEVDFDNIEKMLSQPASNPDPTTVVVLTNNKNIKEESSSEDFKEVTNKTKRAWQDPYVLPSDFQFSEEEKLIIIKTHNINEIELEEVIQDWMSYNVNKVGFNWFGSFNRFCSQRRWEKFRFEPRKFQASNFSPQVVPSQLAKKAKRLFREQKPRLRKAPKPSYLELINQEMELDKIYADLGYSLFERTKLIKQMMEKSYAEI